MNFITRFLLFSLFVISPTQIVTPKFFTASRQDKIDVLTGLENLLKNHMSLLKGKKIGIVTNQTGVDKDGIPNWERISEDREVKIMALFSPEHGLFGETAAGERINYVNSDTILKRYSLYGNKIKPDPESLEDIDLLIYDIQDIGVRTYTYITTLGLILEAAGEANIPVIVLDRPNPITGNRIDGPLLNLSYRSFVGFYPIPIQYGLTPGELAKMICEEGWIESKPSLNVIPLLSWNRDRWFDETNLKWKRPSPNIPDLSTALVYPGMVFLEATNVSEGRGTSFPFRWIGAPWIEGDVLSQKLNRKRLPGVQFKPVQFEPQSLPGFAESPKYKGVTCSGIEIILKNREIYRSVETGIFLLIALKNLYPDKFEIHSEQLNRLAGSDLISRGITNNWSPVFIISKYKKDIEIYRQVRQPYLLY